MGGKGGSVGNGGGNTVQVNKLASQVRADNSQRRLRIFISGQPRREGLMLVQFGRDRPDIEANFTGLTVLSRRVGSIQNLDVQKFLKYHGNGSICATNYKLIYRYKRLINDRRIEESKEKKCHIFIIILYQYLSRFDRRIMQKFIMV